MGGTRTAFYGKTDAAKKGVLPDWDAIRQAGEEQQQTETPAVGYQNNLVDFRDEKFSEKLEGLSERKYAKNGFLRMFSKNNSKEYTRVENTLRTLMENMNHTFTEDIQENNKIIMSSFGKYSDLIDACNVYLKKSGGKTESGQDRKNKVRQILELAQMDMDHLKFLYYDAVRNGEDNKDILTGYTWKEVLQEARESHVEVDDLSKKDTFGSGVKVGEKAGRVLDEGMFTHEEIEDQRIEHHYSGKKKEKEQKRQDKLWKKGKLVEDVDRVAESGAVSYNAFSNRKVRGEGTEDKEVSYGFKHGEIINVGKRNVATSRVANLLGMGDFIAQSKSVSVHDKASGESYKGNLMEKATGQQSSAVESSNAANIKKIKDYNERETAAFDKISPMMQKQFSSLQVLDYICGQGDRNNKNFFVQNTAGVYDHIKGIDNDMSFSTGVDLEAEIRKRKSDVGKIRMVVDTDNNLVIPHMDRKLAEKIMNLSDSDFSFALKDLIEPNMIEYALQRLHKVQAGIEKEMGKGEKSHVFLNDNEWNRDTHDDFMGATFFYRERINKLRKDKVDATDMRYTDFHDMASSLKSISGEEAYEVNKGDSYYSRFMFSMMGLAPSGVLYYYK